MCVLARMFLCLCTTLQCASDSCAAGCNEVHPITPPVSTCTYVLCMNQCIVCTLMSWFSLFLRFCTGEVFAPNDRREIEIRVCSVEAVEVCHACTLQSRHFTSFMPLLNAQRIKKAAVAKLAGLTDAPDVSVHSIVIDFLLWTYASTHREELKHVPIHYVRTIYY